MAIRWERTDTSEANKASKALREAAKVIGWNAPVYLYRFPNGKWSWASENSPIAQQLQESGEVYPTLKADRWFVVGKKTETRRSR